MFNAADRKFMKTALALAEKGLGLASPNPSVGCVIVRDGKIMGRGWHNYALMDHAEVGALKEASGLSQSATAYVTLEPCSHQGRTPPCADRLIQAGVSRVVVARMDPNPRVSGQGIERLITAGIRVDVGLMPEEAGKLIEPFARHVTSGIPLVISKVGMSLDGKIGIGRRDDRWITSPESREFGQRLRLVADALLVGIGTVLADDPELTYRGESQKNRPLMRVILDSQLRTPAAARLFQTKPAGPVLIFCSDRVPEDRGKDLAEQGAEIVKIPETGKGLSLHAVLQELGKRNVLGLLVEGGSAIHWSFLYENLIDCFFFIIAPMVLGGSHSVPAVGGDGYSAISDSPRFKVRRTFSVGPDFVLETYPDYSKSIISPWLSPGSTPSGAQGSSPALRRK